jgi:signal transduction histidine kinase
MRQQKASDSDGTVRPVAIDPEPQQPDTHAMTSEHCADSSCSMACVSLGEREIARGGGLSLSRILATILVAASVLLVPLAGASHGSGGGNRVVRVGVYQNKPKVFMDETGRASGLFIELIEKVAEKEEWTLAFVPCSWAECLDALDEGRIDLMPDVAYSRERDRLYSFHNTMVIESWSQLYSRPDAGIHVLSDLNGMRVATLGDSIQEASFKEMISGFGIAAEIVKTESLQEAFRAVQDGSADVAIANHMFGDHFYREFGLVRISIVFEVSELYFATAHGRNPDLLEAVDRHLTQWRKEPNSIYYAVLSRWMDRPPVGLVPARFLWIIGITILLLLVAVGLVLLLRNQVMVRTRHLSRMNEELRQAQKMEALGKLAGGVAHDFNNQLTVILSYAELALQKLKPGELAWQELTEVVGAGHRAAALTQQLLIFSRKQVLEVSPIDLNQVAMGLEKMLQRILGEDIKLRMSLEPDLGLTLADQGQIEQVFMNLLVNARDAMPSGGNLVVQTANVDLDDVDGSGHIDVIPGPYVMLSVTDSGCGMDEATRLRIFEPFFTTKDRGKGTGLGLSTVYGIVKQRGGHIRVYSEPGIGTVFTIFLPREISASRSVATSVAPLARATGHETILIVEDDKAVRNLAERILRSAGYEVLTASQCDEAMSASAAHSGDINLLLTDVIMPGPSGRALAEMLTRDRPGIRVLFMSGYSDDVIAHQGVLEDGARFIGKPFTVGNLTKKVRDTLDGN